MTQYIDKAALVAELENWKQHTLKCGYAGQGEYEEGNKQGRLDTCEKILSFLDTLEVKEVDLERELMDWWNTHYSEKDYTFEGHTGHYLENSTVIDIAKYFFELGLKTKEK